MERGTELGTAPVLLTVSITVATRSEARVCGRSLSGIAGSSSGGGMDVRLL